MKFNSSHTLRVSWSPRFQPLTMECVSFSASSFSQLLTFELVQIPFHKIRLTYSHPPSQHISQSNHKCLWSWLWPLAKMELEKKTISAHLSVPPSFALSCSQVVPGQLELQHCPRGRGLTGHPYSGSKSGSFLHIPHNWFSFLLKSLQTRSGKNKNITKKTCIRFTQIHPQLTRQPICFSLMSSLCFLRLLSLTLSLTHTLFWSIRT